jgi:hypothetical protein
MVKKGLILAAGGILGYLYYHFIGCISGSCPISSNPYSSILFGILLGAVMIFPSKKNI